MRTLAALILAASVATSASALDRSDVRADDVRPAIAAIQSGRVVRDAAGTIRDSYSLPLGTARGLDAETASHRIAAAALAVSGAGDDVTLDEPELQRSPGGAHYRYRERFRGVEVVNGGIFVTIGNDSSTALLHNRIATAAMNSVSISPETARAALAAAPSILSTELVGRVENARIRFVYRIVVEIDSLPWAYFVDAGNGAIIDREPQFYNARGSVFDANPVTTLNDPTLQDDDDSATAVPSRAYADVELVDLDPSAPTLAGPFVAVTELELPSTIHASPADDLHFDRSDDRFEEVNAYFQIDRSQRYLQSIGFSGPFAVAARAVPVDAHASGGADKSYYKWQVAGQGKLYFGDGGTDDAEDADIVLHEYGHAIQDSITPGGFGGSFASESRALGEAFGDYWAFSSGYRPSIASGRDPFCIADWDARCGNGPSSRCSYPPGADCLRRVDSTKTMSDFVHQETSGTEHENGEIWSSALREIFMKLVGRYGVDAGKPLADRTIIEGMFGMPPNPTFRTAALQLLDADRRLNNGSNASDICVAMNLRGILQAGDCDLTPHGEWTTYASSDREVPIPDNERNGITSVIHVSDNRIVDAVGVHVRIHHTRRGELVIRLIAPDGSSAVLQSTGPDNDTMIDSTYGIDAESASSLLALTGKPAAGDWTLNVSDTEGDDVGALIGWDLQLRFAGNPPVRARTGGPGSRGIFVAGNIRGAAQGEFATDLRIRNRGVAAANVTLYFTPSGSSGLPFPAMNVVIDAQQAVDFENVVRNLFHTSGIGWIAIEGDTANLVISSRTDNRAWANLGEQVREMTPRDLTSRTSVPLQLLGVVSSAEERSNIGVTETRGVQASVLLRILDGSGGVLETRAIDLSPFAHLQIPVSVANAAAATIAVTSGDGTVAAYVSRADNASGDTAFFPPARTHAAGTMAEIAGIIDAPSSDGRWSSTLFLRDVAGTGSVVRLTLRSSSGDPQESSVVIAPSAAISISDLATRFGATAVTGHLHLTVDSGTIAATSITVDDSARGRIGEVIESFAATEGIAAGEPPREIVFVDHGNGWRANFGFSEVSGRSVTVRLRILDARGNVISTTDRTLPPFAFLQILGDAERFPVVSNGAASVEVIGGEGRVLGWASIVDNRSSDFRLLEF